MKRLKAHLAYHSLGCARRSREGIWVPSSQGPLIECLAESADELTVVAYQPEDGKSSGEDATDYLVRGTVQLLELGPKGTWRDSRRRARQVAGVLKEPSENWDLLVFRLPNRRIGEVSRSHRCPRTMAIDGGAIGEEVRTAPLPFGRRLFRAAATAVADHKTKQALGKAEIVFVNSERLAHRHRKVAAGPVEVLRWSLRRERFSFEAPDRLNGSAKVMIAGRATAYKGIFEAFEAFELLKASVLPHAHLHVVGDGDGIPQLRERVAGKGMEGSVTFHGWVPLGEALFSLFKEMDVMLHLSYAESFPRVVWEALAHSVLVVCTPVGGIPDALTDGRDVLFVPPRDARAAAEAVEKLAADPALRRSLLGSGYAKASETALEPTVDNIVDGALKVWPELAAPPRGGLL